MKWWKQLNRSIRQPRKAGRYFLTQWSHQSMLVKTLGLVAISTLIGLLVVTITFIKDLPSVNKLETNEGFAVSTQIFDRNNKLLYEIFADTNRTPVELESLPPYLVQATIAIEDQNFYRHLGLDYVGILRAFYNNLRGESLQGGSTITQQLVKVSLLTRERTFERKIKEAVLTTFTEIRYSKDDILEMYLNYVPYGGTAWGIEAAAQTYFDKSAKDLTLAEAAYLAGLPQSPTRYSPFGSSPEMGKARQATVLDRMAKEKFITKEEAEAAKLEELNFAQPRIDIKAPHFVFYVRDQLIEEYGQAVVERGGLRVTTTLDLDLQEVVQATVSAEIDNLERHKISNGSALVTRPGTGEILAMVGSRDYFNATSEGKINMTVRPRQPGSSMKPINLATAFQLRKLTPGSMLLDIPTCFEAAGSSTYCPRNYDGSYHGPVTMRQALANSYNLPAVKVTAINTVPGLIEVGSAMGITTFRTAENYGVSLGLGAAEIPMTEMATAYGVMANEGVKVPLTSLLRVEDYKGNVLYEIDPDQRRQEVEKQLFLTPDGDATDRPQPDFAAAANNDPDNIKRVLDREVAWLMNDILTDNQARSSAFGSRSNLYLPGYKVAAKTGTTNDLRDNWTIGFNPDYVVATWVGNNNNTAMNPYLVSGITGAAPIWNGIMSYLLENYHEGELTEWPAQPEQVVQASFCRRSGALPNPAGPACEMTTDYFWQGTQPDAPENVWHQTWIAEQTGLPAREGDPTDKLKLEEHVLLTDPFTRDYCYDCQRVSTPQEGEENPPEGEQAQAPATPERYVVSVEQMYEASQWQARSVGQSGFEDKNTTQD
jgi:membrane peptidoglycan carboxypeptidase